ncbi:MAG: HD domain-containing protein [Clostridia bacterium]|nr:HD domain-containing protein [Clostridia bacterium]
MENKAKNVVDFYVICNKLKNVIRTGWKDWHVNKERLESVAEHIYGTQMLAIAMYSEYEYDLDIKKVVYMLSIHEMEEIIIGDLTQFQISREEKMKMGHEAIEKVLSLLADKEYIKGIILEFDERKTPESKFAYYCDKLECDIQCKLYDKDNGVDLTDARNRVNIHDESVFKMLDDGKSWSEMWMTMGQKRYNYDENFLEVSNYAMNNDI